MIMVVVIEVSTDQGPAWVIEQILTEETLRFIDNFRLSLSLDSKRPTVDRRFFADNPITRPISTLIEECLQVIGLCHVFRYQRFLEYHKEGAMLDPHTDGQKICDDTNVTSTHTLLLYLTDCLEGGETLLLDNCKSWDSPIIHATKPKRGRIFLFPHASPHAGAKIISVPKICLRAEVALLGEQKKKKERFIANNLPMPQT